MTSEIIEKYTDAPKRKRRGTNRVHLRARFRETVEDITARDTVWPYKIAVFLLYGKCEGIEDTSPGVRVINYAKLCKHLGRVRQYRLKIHLGILKEMGVLSYYQHHGSYAVVKVARPVCMGESCE